MDQIHFSSRDELGFLKLCKRVSCILGELCDFCFTMVSYIKAKGSLRALVSNIWIPRLNLIWRYIYTYCTTYGVVT
jgi:hypothetical protein